MFNWCFTIERSLESSMYMRKVSSVGWWLVSWCVALGCIDCSVLYFLSIFYTYDNYKYIHILYLLKLTVFEVILSFFLGNHLHIKLLPSGFYKAELLVSSLLVKKKSNYRDFSSNAVSFWHTGRYERDKMCNTFTFLLHWFENFSQIIRKSANLYKS